MRSRVRTLAALLALWTLSLSLTGSAWAAACGTGLPGDDPAPSATAHGAGHPHGHHGAAPAPEGQDDRRRSGERDAPACPLLAVGGAGCLGSFLGAGPSDRAAGSDAETHRFPPPRSGRDLLDTSPPFPPPET